MKQIVTLLVTAFVIMSCGNNAKKAWQEIAPEEIELNPVQMIDGDWLEVSAGKEGNMNPSRRQWRCR